MIRFEYEADKSRLSTQLGRLEALVKDGGEFTLRQVADAIGASEAGASARLRELRSKGWTVTRKQIGKGLFSYRATKDQDNQRQIFA